MCKARRAESEVADGEEGIGYCRDTLPCWMPALQVEARVEGYCQGTLGVGVLIDIVD